MREPDCVEKGKVQRYRNDEFVVASEQAARVLSLLGDGPGEEQKTSVELGLTLVDVPRVHDALKYVREQNEEIGADKPKTARGDLPLDALLNEIRAYFAHLYNGWAPLLGKNRIVFGPGIAPVPNVGNPPTAADGLPRPATAVSLPPATAEGPGTGVRVGMIDTSLSDSDQLAGRYVATDDSLLRDSDALQHWWDLRPPWVSQKAKSALLPYWLPHADFVAGLILKRAPGALLVADTLLDRPGARPESSSRKFSTLWDTSCRLVAQAARGVEVLNCSWGVYTDDNQPPLVLDRAVQRLVGQAAVIAAAGNHGPAADRTDGADLPGPGAPFWPAAFDRVTAVGATDGGSATAGFTPTGPWVNLLAPGVDVVSLYLNAMVQVPAGDDKGIRSKRFYRGAKWSGTSFASATVSGLVAAGTVPGRRSASKALADLLEAAADGSAPPGVRLP
jgi:hypothetical protein